MKKDNKIFLIEPNLTKLIEMKSILEENGYNNIDLFLTPKGCFSKLDKKPNILIFSFNSKEIHQLQDIKKIKKGDIKILILMLVNPEDGKIGYESLKTIAFEFILMTPDYKKILLKTINRINKQIK